MAEQMQITAQEHGLIRVFAVDLEHDALATFSERSDTTWPLQEALGASHLDGAYVELFDVADLEDLGLAGYMRQGLGVAPHEIKDMRLQIDALAGPVLIVLSKAFGGEEQVLHPKNPLRWIGTFHEETADVQFKPLKSDAAKGAIPAPPPETKTNPHLTLLTAILALPVIVGLLALLLWLVLR